MINLQKNPHREEGEGIKLRIKLLVLVIKKLKHDTPSPSKFYLLGLFPRF